MAHPIIKTDNYILITSNEEIKLGDYLYYKHFDGDVIAKATETADLENINNPDRFFKKIIAHLPINPWPEFAPPENLEGVPLLPPLPNDEDEWELDNDNIDKGVEKNGLGYVNGYYGGFVDGVKKAKEKYKFTEEDIDKAYRAGMQFVGEDKGSYKEFIQSLSQPKLPVGFKVAIKNMKTAIDDHTITGWENVIVDDGVVQGRWIFE